MSKCEWKDGVFCGCISHHELKRGLPVFEEEKPFDSLMGIDIHFCPFCGADIRKPEPEVIIKKSGETWVARYDGVDYLYKDISISKPMFVYDMVKTLCTPWKPISEIEITDEIAKLRPMVNVELTGIEKLYGAENNYALTIDGLYSMKIINVELATVSDLENE